ncbi:MAG: response regulator transcription factor [Alphaproteobacteria bacterium]|nr:response regulator transcription factor [Alphaproteobacteria bacterium]MBL6936510.1 response regulator transcription factor [Alphaproteobacteria bacterium]MBL7098439.1 response regulator transcription factor [Alphaproteobacteria bacterium]
MKILVADDHPLYREAVTTQLHRLYPESAVDEVGTYDEIVSAAKHTTEPFDLFLVDFHMPGMMEQGIASLAGAFPDTPIAVISGTANSEDVRASIRAGARGFVSKTATADHLAHTIQLVLSGGTSVPADMLSAPDIPYKAHSTPQPDWLGRLSPREREVLTAVARGISNKQIGRELNLAEVTVKLHLRSIFRKTGAKTRSECAVLATKAGLG